MAAAYGGAALAVLRRDFTIFVSYRTRLFSQVFMIVFAVSLFYYLSRLVRVEQFRSPDEYFAFVVVGLVTLRGVTSAFTITTATIRQELVAGTFERMVSSPFGAAAGAVSAGLFPFALGFVLSLFTLAFSTLAFGIELHWETVPLALPVALLSALTFTPFALIFVAAVIVFKQAVGGVGFVVIAISFVSGFYFPVDLLPGWLRWMSDVQPFTAVVDLLRHLLLGLPLEGDAGTHLAKIAGFAAVLLPLSYLLLRTAVEAGRRRATITEY